jgi:energy-converting hydrogenase Eha subunit B
MAGVEVRGLAALQRCFALHPLARGVHFLCLLCYSQPHAAGILLPSHTIVVLRAPASALVTALLHFVGDLCPLL